jgi:valyl-tRNA synthetase
MEKKGLSKEDLKVFYPTDLLVTGFDIIFFWVARMVLMGMYHMKEIPFENVYIHGLIRDKEGKKMSKVKGNIVDPLDMIEKYGTDALRFTLAIQTIQGSDIKFNEEVLEGYKHFANKIWNASRYILMNLPSGQFKVKDPLEFPLAIEDKWILYVLNETIRKVDESLENYEFSKGAEAIYTFFWDEFCDWYIELTKHRVYKGEAKEKETALNTLVYVLDKALKLLHPFMPYITEEIWSKMPTKDKKSISLAKFPGVREDFSQFEDAAKKIEWLKKVISSIREIRNLLNISLKERLKAFYVLENPEIEETLKEVENHILNLGKLNNLQKVSEKPTGKYAEIPLEGLRLYLYLGDSLNISEMKDIQSKRKTKLLRELKRVEAKLKNENFLKKAPREVVEKEKRIYEELKLELSKTEKILELLEKL